jgi:hypothetical protein
MTLIRQAIADLNDLTRQSYRDVVDDVVKYYNRQTDKSTIRTAMKTRYGVGVKKVDDGVADSGSTIETYAREGFSEKVDAGLEGSLTSGFGPKIVNALATLFTERTQKYSLVHDTADDTDPADELLNSHRVYGGYQSTLTKADKLSIQTGSSAVYVSFVRDHCYYQKFSPADITVYFAESGYVKENGVERLVDQRQLEDATAVRIRLSQVDETTWNYLCIFGRSNIYKQGRHVQYQSDSLGADVPNIGEPGVIDWYPEGSNTVANPLSWYADQNPDEPDLPEYPLAILYGGTTDSGDTMPVSTSLYDDCVEIDLAASHLLSTSQDAAAGTTAITRDATGRSAPLPTNITGKVALPPGMEIQHIDLGADASIDAMKVLKDLQVQVAAGYGVPDYMAISEDHMLEASTGIALAIKTRPLEQARKDRVELNGPFVDKIFQIEKSLISMHSAPGDDEASISLLSECEQQWDAGELKLPENRKEKTERTVQAKEAGFIDIIEAIRRENNLVSDEEAIAFYEKMRDRESDYPDLKKEEPVKKPLGLPGRSQATGL